MDNSTHSSLFVSRERARTQQSSGGAEAKEAQKQRRAKTKEKNEAASFQAPPAMPVSEEAEDKSNNQEELVMVSGGSMLKEMPDTSDKVDGSVCEMMVSLGSETNINTEGDAVFLNKLYPTIL